jgi:hypothetical protein
VRRRLQALTGREPVAWERRDEGGYSEGERWVVTFADGGTAFVKAAWRVEDEHLVYSTCDFPCLPRLIAYEPGLLVTEDLSHATWGTPLTAGDALALGAALDLLRDVPAPAGLREWERPPAWEAFAADPAPLLATGLVDEAWLRHLPSLAEAEAGVSLGGDRLVHGDLWLQNWCRVPGRGVVIVDWAGAYAGNADIMRAAGEAAVRAAGGPPGLVLSGAPEWAAWIAGQTAKFVADQTPEWPPRLAETERREALSTLRWACDELDLPYPASSGAFTSLGPWRP